MGDPVGMIKHVTDVYMKRQQIAILDDFKKLKYEMESWAKDYKERQEELEDAYYNLKPNWILNPLDLVDKGNEMFYMEKPDRFYARTVETKNPGVESLNLIRQFYDMCLKLPEIGERNPLMALNQLPIPGEK
jgi:hypothetical protein